MKTKRPKKHGGRRPGAGRPRLAEPKTTLRLNIAHADAVTIHDHPDGYRLAKEAVAAVAFALRNPDLPPQA